MAHSSSPELLVLHALRVKGMADAATVAGRFALDPDLVDELLLDYESFGWISRVRFADIDGWALTKRGQVEDEQRLADELDNTGTRPEVVAAHDAFLALNSRFLATITNWQIRPRPTDPLAANDHGDPHWDERVLDDLRDLHHGLAAVGSSSPRHWIGLPDIRHAMKRPWSGRTGASDRGSPSPRSTLAIPSGWNFTRTCWLLSA